MKKIKVGMLFQLDRLGIVEVTKVCSFGTVEVVAMMDGKHYRVNLRIELADRLKEF